MPSYATSFYPPDLAYVVDFLAGSLSNYQELGLQYLHASTAGKARDALLRCCPGAAGGIRQVGSGLWADKASGGGAVFTALTNVLLTHEADRSLDQALIDHVDLIIRLAIPSCDNAGCAAFLPGAAATLEALLSQVAQRGITRYSSFLDAFRNFSTMVQAHPDLAPDTVDALRTTAVLGLIESWDDDFLEKFPWMRTYYQNWLAQAPCSIPASCLLYPLSRAGSQCNIGEDAILRTGARLENTVRLPAKWIVATQCIVRRLVYDKVGEASAGTILTGDLHLHKRVEFLGPVHFGKNVEVKSDWRLPSGLRIADHAVIQLLVARKLPPGTFIHGNVRVEADSQVHAGAIFGDNVEVGQRCELGAGITIGDYVKIEDDVAIGTNCFIQQGLHVKRNIASNSVVTNVGIYTTAGDLLVGMPALAETIGEVEWVPITRHARHLKTLPLIIVAPPLAHVHFLGGLTQTSVAPARKRSAAQMAPALPHTNAMPIETVVRKRARLAAAPAAPVRHERERRAPQQRAFVTAVDNQQLMALIDAALNSTYTRWDGRVFFIGSVAHGYARQESDRIILPWAPIETILQAVAARDARISLRDDLPPLRTSLAQTARNWLGFLVRREGGTLFLVCREKTLRHFLQCEKQALAGPLPAATTPSANLAEPRLHDRHGSIDLDTWLIIPAAPSVPPPTGLLPPPARQDLEIDVRAPRGQLAATGANPPSPRLSERHIHASETVATVAQAPASTASTGAPDAAPAAAYSITLEMMRFHLLPKPGY